MAIINAFFFFYERAQHILSRQKSKEVRFRGMIFAKDKENLDAVETKNNPVAKKERGASPILF